MSAKINRQWKLKSRPAGMVAESDFEMTEESVPELSEGEFLVRNLYFAFEPAMRGWLNDVKSYVPPVQIGEVMRSSTVGQVVESKHPRFKENQIVSGTLGWQEYAVSDGKPGPMGGVSLVQEGVSPDLALGALGGTGLTAYFGMLEVGKPKPGDTVVVSGAAGATGSVAGQVARIAGAGRVVGIAGGKQKCAWLVDELGYDAAIDYKSENLRDRIKAECPRGVDVFFDNVGGEILNDMLLEMNVGGRIALCGGISSYNDAGLPPGPSNYMQLVIRRCKMEGFLLLDYLADAREAVTRLAGWIQDGKLKHAADIQEGFENTPKTFLRLFTGENRGKQLLKIADPT